MDTWHILEQRFHDIGNRDHNVVMQFYEKNGEEYGYSLEGPRPEGEWIGVLVGRPLDGSTPKQDFSTGHYSVTDLGDTLFRAAKLLNVHEKRDCYDPIGMGGSMRFVALLVKNYGQLAHEVVVTVHTIRFFANAARACGMMAGKLAAKGKDGSKTKTEESRKEMIRQIMTANPDWVNGKRGLILDEVKEREIKLSIPRPGIRRNKGYKIIDQIISEDT